MNISTARSINGEDGMCCHCPEINCALATFEFRNLLQLKNILNDEMVIPMLLISLAVYINNIKIVF